MFGVGGCDYSFGENAPWGQLRSADFQGFRVACLGLVAGGFGFRVWHFEFRLAVLRDGFELPGVQCDVDLGLMF